MSLAQGPGEECSISLASLAQENNWLFAGKPEMESQVHGAGRSPRWGLLTVWPTAQERAGPDPLRPTPNPPPPDCENGPSWFRPLPRASASPSGLNMKVWREHILWTLSLQPSVEMLLWSLGVWHARCACSLSLLSQPPLFLTRLIWLCLFSCFPERKMTFILNYKEWDLDILVSVERFGLIMEVLFLVPAPLWGLEQFSSPLGPLSFFL